MLYLEAIRNEKISDPLYFFIGYDKLQNQQPKFVRVLMKPDPATMKLLLRKRVAELEKIIRQMKQDNLHSSPVYKNLEQELEHTRTRLIYPEG